MLTGVVLCTSFWKYDFSNTGSDTSNIHGLTSGVKKLWKNEPTAGQYKMRDLNYWSNIETDDLFSFCWRKYCTLMGIFNNKMQIILEFFDSILLLRIWGYGEGVLLGVYRFLAYLICYNQRVWACQFLPIKKSHANFLVSSYATTHKTVHSAKHLEKNRALFYLPQILHDFIHCFWNHSQILGQFEICSNSNFNCMPQENARFAVSYCQ